MTKKFFAVIIALLISAFSVGCGTYTPPSDNSKKPSGSGGSGSGDDTPGQTAFTLTLVCEDDLPSLDGIYAQWSGNNGIFRAEFDKDGVASVTGLDGDYTITLSAVPDGYTYDPNYNNVATNSRKDVEIELLKIIPTTGAGDGLYVQPTGKSAISVSTEGTYRTTLSSQSQIVYYEFKPKSNGKYSITSWVDITSNEINPIMDFHSGNAQFKSTVPTKVYNDGGSYSTFTKNFKFELQLATDEVNNVWTFGVHADVVKGKSYPVIVDFTIKYEDDYERDDENYEVIHATGNLQSMRPAGTFRYNYLDTGRRLDSSRFKLNPDDGYYHLVANPSIILFAKLSKDCEVFAQTNSGNGFLDGDIFGWLYFDGINYMSFITEYTDHCNEDGAHPVTEELKQFLQGYAAHQKMFMDGNGIGETKTKLKSLEDDQWLFACGYYA